LFSYIKYIYNLWPVLYIRNGLGHDTVGAVALDISGNVACGTSTGGITAKRPGRVGDSPVVGWLVLTALLTPYRLYHVEKMGAKSLFQEHAEAVNTV
jgi:hypothetical protein